MAEGLSNWAQGLDAGWWDFDHQVRHSAKQMKSILESVSPSHEVVRNPVTGSCAIFSQHASHLQQPSNAEDACFFHCDTIQNGQQNMEHASA